MQILLQGWRWVDYLHLLPTDQHGPGEILAEIDIKSHINTSTGTHEMPVREIGLELAN